MCRIGLESSECRAQRGPFQCGDGDIVDDVAFPQARQRVPCPGVEPKFRDVLDIDIERVEKQPAVRRIRTAIGRMVVEQNVQRIEPDAICPELLGKPAIMRP